MDMSNSVVLPAPQTQVWAALNDPEILKQCVPGCESIERIDDNAYQVAMTVAIGPVRAKFKGNLRLTDIDAPNAYTLQFDGQGGAAGFGKGTARVKLTPEDAGTRLDYVVNAQIGGKIAQLGSRLVDGVSRKMADEFFESFRVALAASMAPAETPAAAASTEIAAPARRGAIPAWGWALLIIAAAAFWFFTARG